jgi:hypothetical protein
VRAGVGLVAQQSDHFATAQCCLLVNPDIPKCDFYRDPQEPVHHRLALLFMRHKITAL